MIPPVFGVEKIGGILHDQGKEMTGRERLKIFIESYSVFDDNNKADRAKRFLTFGYKTGDGNAYHAGQSEGRRKNCREAVSSIVSMYQHPNPIETIFSEVTACMQNAM